MFSQSADTPASDESPAPIGMRELPPQPAKPVMPAYATSTPEPAADDGPSSDDSVIARDDHLEGTFTSRGTVVVMGSVKGRIEAVRLRIEDGASVDADVIVDEAIVAGEFTGNLTCRQRLEARASGRINGRVETYKLMLHEGASVEGEMHMLSETPKDASETIRGSAPLRGETASEPTAKAKPVTPPTVPAGSTTVTPAATKPAPSVAPASDSKPSATASAAPVAEASSVRSTLADTLRAETLQMRVAPRATTTSRGYGSPARSSSGARNGGSTTGF